MIATIAGFLSSLAFTFCEIPLLIDVFKSGQAKEINLNFMVLCLIGQGFGLIYASYLSPFPVFLLINYALGLVSSIIILGYKLHDRQLQAPASPEKRYRGRYRKTVLEKPAN